MIKSFNDKQTEKIFNRQPVKKLDQKLYRKAHMKLISLDAAAHIRDLEVPPSNCLERMKGKWKAYHSIRVTKQYRVLFKWDEGNAFDVWFGDYHDRL